MFAEKTELNLIEENTVVELNAFEVEEVSGAWAPLAWWAARSAATKIVTYAAGGGTVAGVSLAWLVNR